MVIKMEYTNINTKVNKNENTQPTELDKLIESLHNDKDKIGQFIYSIVDRYNYLMKENQEIEDTLQDNSQTENQKKYFLFKLKQNRIEMQHMIDSLPALFNNLTEIPVKIQNIYSKKKADESVTFEDADEFISRDSIYDDDD